MLLQLFLALQLHAPCVLWTLAERVDALQDASSIIGERRAFASVCAAVT